VSYFEMEIYRPQAGFVVSMLGDGKGQRKTLPCKHPTYTFSFNKAKTCLSHIKVFHPSDTIQNAIH
jgi:hypothetical protein